MKQNIKSSFLILSWSLYDLANQFFVLIVVSLYFVRWLTLEKHIPEIFFSLSFAVSTFLVALFSPVLGAISDASGRRRPFLVFFTLLSIIFTFPIAGSNFIILNLCFFIMANFGCQTAVVFYNALMVNIAPKERLGFVSGLGRVFGYIGAVLALFLIKPVIIKNGYKAAFVPTGIWFFIFSLPCMLFVKDKDSRQKIDLSPLVKKEKLLEIIKNLRGIFFEKSGSAELTNFLKAVFWGLCSVNVIILFMSIYATKVFGLNEAQIVNLVAFSSFFAILGSITSGIISDYIGHKRCLLIVFILWIICFWAGAFADKQSVFWVIGALVGFSLGSIWVVSRALAIKLVPEEKIGEVFGLFNLVDYAASVVGAVFWGVTLYFLSPWADAGYRAALLSLIIFMALGIIFLLRLKESI